jgi:hypothetical protein
MKTLFTKAVSNPGQYSIYCYHFFSKKEQKILSHNIRDKFIKFHVPSFSHIDECNAEIPCTNVHFFQDFSYVFQNK